MIFIYLILNILILPIMIPLQFILSWLWFPKVGYKPIYQELPENLQKDISDLIPIFNHDITKYFGLDSAKFLGMWYYILKDQNTWDILKDYWDWTDYSFFRKDNDEVAFSGDMLSGMLLAIVTRYKQGLLTDNEESFLSKLSWNLVFKTKLPFKFNHPDMSRGYFWQPFSLCMAPLLHVLQILKLGYTFNKGYKSFILKMLYYILLGINYPLLLVGMYDRNIYLRRFYACWWYAVHSDSLVYTSAIMLDLPFAEKGLTKLYKRYGDYNADITALHEKHVEYYSNGPNMVKYMCLGLYLNRNVQQEQILENYYSIRDLPKQVIAFIKNLSKGKVTPLLVSKQSENRFISVNRCQDRTWERNPQEVGSPNSNVGDLDILFGLYIMKESPYISNNQ